MGRLIDADKLLETLQDLEPHCENKDYEYGMLNTMRYYMPKIINDEPTVFDADKVVEQLEEERELSYADFDRYVEDVSQCLDAEYDDFFHRGLERAVKIVKGGGVDASDI